LIPPMRPPVTFNLRLSLRLARFSATMPTSGKSAKLCSFPGQQFVFKAWNRMVRGPLYTLKKWPLGNQSDRGSVMNALAWIRDCLSPPSARVVTGKVPDDEEAKKVRDQFFGKKADPRETKSHLYDRMQSGGK